MQYFSFSRLWRGCASKPMQHSPTQCLSSVVSHLLGYSRCDGNLSAGPTAEPQACSACAAALHLPKERICHILPNVHTVTGSFIGVIP